MTEATRRRRSAVIAVMAAAILGGCTSASSPAASTASLEPSLTPGVASTEPTASATPTAAEPTVSLTASASESASAEPSADLPGFACSPSTGLAATTPRATITDVRIGTHDGYDRVVFEFDSGIPTVTVAAALPPFYEDASGLPVVVIGSAFLRVTMTGASAVNPDGVVVYDGPNSFTPGFPRLAHLVRGGDFEAVSTWYIGLNGGACLRVFALESPSRLVIDIEH